MSQQDESLSPEEAKARLAEFEQAKMTRRNLLARFGFKVAAATVAALTADDLLRAVGKEMERRSGDNEVAQQVAEEFKNVGIAFAGPSGCRRSGNQCVGPDCLQTMPLCGCTCTEGPKCQDCCDEKCPGSGNTACYAACQNG
jgi:hypothetical protein